MSSYGEGTLTPREIEIVVLAGQGMTNTRIATFLSVSPSTIRNHLHNAYRKLDVTSRAGAVRAAILAELLDEID